MKRRRPVPPVALVTMTRDRKDLTQKMVASLVSRPSMMAYDHYFLDQGSTDGTPGYLRRRRAVHKSIVSVKCLKENVGISVGLNTLYDAVCKKPYEFVFGIDNDVEMRTRFWLKRMVEAYKLLQAKHEGPLVLAPRILNLEFPPPTFATLNLRGFSFSFVDILGGAARFMPVEVVREFRFNERLPKGWGQDQEFAAWCRERRIPMVYVEQVKARHALTDGETRAEMPDYMERKEMDLHVPFGL